MKRWIFHLSLFLILCLSTLILGFRYLLLPVVIHYKSDLEGLLSARLGQQVSIGEMQTAWHGLSPSARLINIELRNELGQVVLVLPSVFASLSWSSIPAFEPRLGRLTIDGAKLEAMRDKQGRIYVAGIPLVASQGDSAGLAWLLRQGDIQVKNTEFKWIDQQASQQVVHIKSLQVRLKNLVNFHRVGLQGDVHVYDESNHRSMPLQVQLRFFSPLFGYSKAHMQAWRGEAYLQTHNFSLQTLAKINSGLALPDWLKNAQGQFQVWLGFNQAQMEQATVDLNMASVEIENPQSGALHLKDLQGRLVYEQDPDKGLKISANHLRVSLDDLTQQKSDQSLEVLGPLQARLHLKQWPNWQAASGELELEKVDLSKLSSLMKKIPLSGQFNQLVHTVNIQGQLPYLSLNWNSALNWQDNFNLTAKFTDISTQSGLLPNGWHFPGLAGLSGQIKGNASAGFWQLQSGAGFVELPNLLKFNRIEFSDLQTQGGWRREPLQGQQGTKVIWDRFAVRQGHASVNMLGSLHFLDGKPLPVVKLTGQLDGWSLQSIPNFLPVTLNSETNQWLRRGLQAGVVQKGRWVLQGDLEHFPFLQPKQGVFQITGQLHQADVLFDSAWPNIRGVMGDARFVNGELTVVVNKAQTLKNVLSDVVVKLPILNNQSPVLTVTGNAQGALQDFFSYIQSSPLNRLFGGAFSESKATGNAKLKLALQIPIAQPEKSQVKGQLLFIDNDVSLISAIPAIQKLRGELEFSQTGFSIENLTGQTLGGAVRIDTQLKPDKSLLLHVEGQATAAGLKRYLSLPNALKISGQTRYGVHIRFKPNMSMADLNIESQLLGLGVDLPLPFAKSATTAWPMDIRMLPTQFNKQGEILRDEIRVQINTGTSQFLSARLERDRTLEQPKILRAAVSVGESLVMPDAGFKLALRVGRLDLDAWQRLDFLSGPNSNLNSNLNADGEVLAEGLHAKNLPLLPDQILIKSDQLVLGDKTINNLKLNAKRLNDRWQFDLLSDQITGNLQWLQGDRTNKAGSLVMRLKHLTIPEPQAFVTEQKSPALIDSFEMPALDVVVDQLKVGKIDLGLLRLKAVNEIGVGQNNWLLKDLEVLNDDVTLKATGNWGRQRFGAVGQTNLNFNLNINDAGHLLERIGMHEVLRSGSGNLAGELSWAGMPYSFDYPTMKGKLTLNINRGQFLKAEPGVARLVGILSLQSIMKRLTLDFRDLFAEGFAFDQIYATADIKNGVLQTKDFKLRGTAANVFMEGQVDLVKETQDLTALILPEISAAGGSLVYSIIAANPAVGLASFLAQMVLKDPLSRVFSFEYKIGGTWDDPIVQKVDASTARK